jgi:threonine synthase
LLLSPEGAATYAAYLAAARAGRIGASDTAILFNCASGLKYPMPHVSERMALEQPFAGVSL